MENKELLLFPSVPESLNSILAVLTKYKHPLKDWLRPRLANPDELRLYFIEQTKLKIPDSLVDIYVWHDGVDFSRGNPLHRDIMLTPLGYYIPNFNDSLQLYIKCLSKYKLQRNLFPFLTNYSDDLYLVDIDHNSNQYGCVFQYHRDFNELSGIYHSINALFGLWAKCYLNAIFFFDENRNSFAVDIPAYAALMADYMVELS